MSASFGKTSSTSNVGKENSSLDMDINAVNASSIWWEHEFDHSVLPAAHGSEVSTSEVYRLDIVRDEEVRDIMFAVQFIPLGRAATAAVQVMNFDFLHE